MSMNWSPLNVQKLSLAAQSSPRSLKEPGAAKEVLSPSPPPTGETAGQPGTQNQLCTLTPLIQTKRTQAPESIRWESVLSTVHPSPGKMQTEQVAVTRWRADGGDYKWNSGIKEVGKERGWWRGHNWPQDAEALSTGWGFHSTLLKTKGEQEQNKRNGNNSWLFSHLRSLPQTVAEPFRHHHLSTCCSSGRGPILWKDHSRAKCRKPVCWLVMKAPFSNTKFS